ncbi:hypothetical protein MCERE19_00838 [Spirosomataceae bacterium]|jgi:hypothetical protein
MKTNKIDLEIDFIGGQGSLTKTEEKELSDFFKSRKLSARTNTISKQVGTNTRPNVVA